jgi:hypothetical protein
MIYAVYQIYYVLIVKKQTLYITGYGHYFTYEPRCRVQNGSKNRLYAPMWYLLARTLLDAFASYILFSSVAILTLAYVYNEDDSRGEDDNEDARSEDGGSSSTD